VRTLNVGRAVIACVTVHINVSISARGWWPADVERIEIASRCRSAALLGGGKTHIIGKDRGAFFPDLADRVDRANATIHAGSDTSSHFRPQALIRPHRAIAGTRAVDLILEGIEHLARRPVVHRRICLPRERICRADFALCQPA
jgi:hypothetical protein